VSRDLYRLLERVPVGTLPIGLKNRLRARAIAAGDQARDMRNWIVAVEHYARAVALSDRIDGIIVQLGHALKESGQYQRALSCYEQYAAAVPDDADIYLQLGHLSMVTRRFDEAARHYRQARAHAQPGTWIERDALRGMQTAALEATRGASDPALAMLHHGTARNAYARLVELVETQGAEELTGTLGKLCREIGLFEEAERYFRRYCQVAERLGLEFQLDAHIQWGQLDRLRGQPHRAIGRLRQAAQLIGVAPELGHKLVEIENETSLCLKEITRAFA